jgi:hypothetical protein
MARDAFKQVATGYITGTTAGVDVPVAAAIPVTDHLNVYAVSLTNIDGAVVAHYVEPEGRGEILALGTPIAADATAVSNFSPRDVADVHALGNPQIATAASTAIVAYRIYVKSV